MVGLSLCALCLRAQVNPNEIPHIHQPHPALSPTYWEQHGTEIIGVSSLGVLAVVLIIWWLMRPRPAMVPPPAARARAALAAISPNPDEGARLSRVSHVVRQYFQEVFDLSPGEMTTAEFCAAAVKSNIGDELAREIENFMRTADRRKFSAVGMPADGGDPVATALSLIERGEARRLSLAGAPTMDMKGPVSQT